MKFDQWITKLKAEFEKNDLELPDFSYETWGDYYSQDYTPKEAFDEDLSYAD